jgi:hypothetical protein
LPPPCDSPEPASRPPERRSLPCDDDLLSERSLEAPLRVEVELRVSLREREPEWAAEPPLSKANMSFQSQRLLHGGP